MRLNIIADIDGTDEQQLAMLELLEDYVETKSVLGIFDHDNQLDLDMVYVSVTEIPERQVRGKGKPHWRRVKHPKPGDMATHVNGKLDPRTVVAVDKELQLIKLELLNKPSHWLFAENYTFKRLFGAS